MLLPLLASPVRDYGWNLLLQSQLIILSAAGCIILLHLIDSNRGNEPAVRVPITALLLLCFYKPVASVVLLLPGSPYFVSLFLLLSGIYLFTVAQSRPVIRWTGAAVLVLLSFWVNISNIVIAAIAIAIWPRRIGFRARISAAGLVVLSAALVTMFSAQYPGSDFRQLVSIEGWLGALLQMIGNVKTTMRGSAIATAVGAAVLFESINRHRTQWQYSPRDALAIAATAQIGATAASSWVALNGFDSRYITGPVFLILSLALFILTTPVAAALERAVGSATAIFVCCLLCIAIVTKAFGLPSPQAALARVSAGTSDVPGPPEQLSCTHVIGNYWWVWEAAFHDRLRTGERRIWAVTHRSDATQDAWKAVPIDQRRYCGLCADNQIEHMREREGVGRLEQQPGTKEICVFRELPE